MGRPQKKGVKGAANVYISRNQALKKLQLSLPDFRRLCILKSIYPRVPTNFKHLSRTSTYYYRKDIAFLAHEPLLHKFREFKTFSRKISRALGKGDKDSAERLSENKPVYTVDHLVKERYPSFIDALRDLDDALCMIFLFRIMPRSGKVRSDLVTACDTLAREFMNYIVASNSLRKVFLSIKGIYYQANIMGQTITWIAPFTFSQKVSDDVDFRVMLNFLEFYTTAVGFVNCRLYHSLGFKYPPDVNAKVDGKTLSLKAFTLNAAKVANEDEKEDEEGKKDSDGDENTTKEKEEDMEVDDETLKNQMKESAERMKTLKKAMNKIQLQEDKEEAKEDKEEEEKILDEFKPSTAGSDDLNLSNVLDEEVVVYKKLFHGCKFFLGREVPRESLEFLIRSCGGQVSWDGLSYNSSDKTITHQIIDRPVTDKISSRYYVQPQWIYDCLNAKKLLPVEKYIEGELLPPHLSPFETAENDDYDPSKPLLEEGEQDEENLAQEDDDEEDELERHQAELEAERTGVSFSNAPDEESKSSKKKKVKKAKRNAQQLEDEEKELAKIMMTNKHKKLYEKMMFGKDRKTQAVNKLKEKRAAIDGSAKKMKVDDEADE